MIVPMSKVMVAARRQDRTRLLNALGDLGVVHIQPVDPEKAVADDKTLEKLSEFNQALRILQGIQPAGQRPDVTVWHAVEETILLQKCIAEEREQLSTLQRLADQLAPWGDVRVSALTELRDAGVEILFYSVAQACVADLKADCVQVLSHPSGGQCLVGIIDRQGHLVLPDQAKRLDWPSRDLASVKQEAAELDASIQANSTRLTELAWLVDALQAKLEDYEAEAEHAIAQSSGLSSSALFALEGWIPTAEASCLGDQLSDQDIRCAVDILDDIGDESPPTLIEYPKWAQPIKGLFDVLGTVAGYHEFDVSVPFMLALPIFAAMLIGDGGYGAILCIGLLLGYKKIAPALGEQFTKLLIIVGAVSLLWGFVCGSFFGVIIYKPPIPVDMSDSSRFLLMQISFFMGTIHLSVAQLWQSVKLFPDLRFLGKVGWATFIWGMLGVVRMFVLNTEMSWATPWPYLLIAGTTLAILFDSPSKNILKTVLTGVANFPLAMLGAFSDIISYVRLMAVGLASGVLAASFNELASEASLLIAIPTLVFGHALNIGLALIALFAHGVRLNMLEFSNNLGMQWTGYVYKPFSKKMIQE
jgi:V/A-type H+/Na+-transporting ATPase subunit I